MAIHGGCACGAVRYELARDALPPVYCCHCRDCQTRSGSAFNETAVVRAGELEVTGPVTVFDRTTPSGQVFKLNLCGTCHSPLLAVSAQAPEIVLLRAGSLDESDALVPVAHIWTSRKQPWVGLPDGVPQWEEAPSPEFFALVGFA